MTTTKVLIVEDHPVVAEGLELLLGSTDGIEVSAHTGSGEEAVRMAKQDAPEIMLVDLKLPGMSGLEVIKEVRASNPEIRIIVLTNVEARRDIFEALKFGVDGYLLKTCNRTELLDAIGEVKAGRTCLSPTVMQSIVQSAVPGMDGDTPIAQLTDREKQVLKMMAHGAMNKEIAAELFVSENTVKTHVARILDKMDVRDRTQAVAYGIRDGLIEF